MCVTHASGFPQSSECLGCTSGECGAYGLIAAAPAEGCLQTQVEVAAMLTLGSYFLGLLEG